MGVTGSDLAAAIVGSLRIIQSRAPAGVATLSDSEFVEDRVARLLRTLETNPASGHRSLLLLFMVTVLFPFAFFLGTQYGEGLVRSILMIC